MIRAKKRNPGGSSRTGSRVTSRVGQPTTFEIILPPRALDAIADVIDAIDVAMDAAARHVGRLDSLMDTFPGDIFLAQKRAAVADDSARAVDRVRRSLRAIERRGGTEDRMVTDLRALRALARDASEVL